LPITIESIVTVIEEDATYPKALRHQFGITIVAVKGYADSVVLEKANFR
jgi:hypothetical protein